MGTVIYVEDKFFAHKIEKHARSRCVCLCGVQAAEDRMILDVR